VPAALLHFGSQSSVKIQLAKVRTGAGKTAQTIASNGPPALSLCKLVQALRFSILAKFGQNLK